MSGQESKSFSLSRKTKNHSRYETDLNFFLVTSLSEWTPTLLPGSRRLVSDLHPTPEGVSQKRNHLFYYHFIPLQKAGKSSTVYCGRDMDSQLISCSGVNGVGFTPTTKDGTTYLPPVHYSVSLSQTGFQQRISPNYGRGGYKEVRNYL